MLSRPQSPSTAILSISPSPTMKSAPDVEALVLSYLDTIEIYQSHILQLSQCLADGFIHLAEANFHAPPGRRYGKDYYDARMTASRVVEITENDIEGNAGIGKQLEFMMRMRGEESCESKKLVTRVAQTATVRERKLQSHSKTPPLRTTSICDDEAPLDPDNMEAATQEPNSAKSMVDPISWFGVLTPSTLRSAQASFTRSLPAACAVLNTLRKLSNIFRELHVYKLLPSRPPLPLPDVLPPSQLDSDSGYIHLCAAEQANGVIQRFMGGVEEIWLLRIPLLRIHHDLKWETAKDVHDEVFPHLFASLRREHIAAIGKWVDGGIDEMQWEKLSEAGTS